MKRFFALIFVFIFVSLQAQWKVDFDKDDKNNLEDQKRISYGYFLGVNYFDFKMHPSDAYRQTGLFTVEPEGGLGFSAGLMGKLKINNRFDLRLQPGIHFTERTLHFKHLYEDQVLPLVDTISYVVTKEDLTRQIKSSYIDIPLLLEFHGSRWFNTRPYLMAGVGYAVNLQSEESSEDDNLDGVFRLKTHSFNYQLEGGISIYFNKFKLTPSIKGIFFFNNELVQDDPETPNVWAGSMKSLHTRAVMFSLKFE